MVLQEEELCLGHVYHFRGKNASPVYVVSLLPGQCAFLPVKMVNFMPLILNNVHSPKRALVLC